MAIKNTFEGSSLLLALAMIFVMCGCGQTDTESTESTTGQPSKPANKVAQRDLSEQLVGYWYGTARVDEQLLDNCLADFNDTDRAQAQSVVSAFRTTEMAMLFSADGEMQNEIEMSIDGAPVRQAANGTWKLVEQTKDSVVIAMVEQLADGTITNSQKKIRFYPDGNRFAIKAPLGDDLDAAGAVLVFERQVADQVASETDEPTQRR